MRKVLGALMALVLVVSACGGGDSSDDGGGDGAAEAPETTQAPAATEAPSNDGGSEETTATAPAPPPEDDGGGEGSGESTATVTVGGETYAFSSEGAIVAQCLADIFGIFSVQLPMADGGDGSVKIVALHPDTDPDVVGEVNAIEVSVGDDDWVADEADMMFEQIEALQPGMGQVDSVEIDGRTVRGTATFFRQLSLFTDTVETTTGTFEATCGEERTS